MRQNIEYLKEYIQISNNIISGEKINPAIPLGVIRKKRQPAIVFDSADRITEMYINQSLVKRLLFRQTERTDVCPHNLYRTYILRDLSSLETESMLFGKYFESMTIGSSADDVVTDLPRNSKTGKKRVDHERIDEAIMLFKYIQKSHGIITESWNTQIDRKEPFIDPEKICKPSYPVYLICKGDLVSPFRSEKYNIEEKQYIIDLKLTKDRELCYFDKERPWNTFSWGCPEELDHLQATMYSHMFQLPFIYLVFDYNPKTGGIGWKPLPIKTLISHPDDSEAKRRQREMLQSLRFTIAKLENFHALGWPQIKCDSCKNCPVYDCKEKFKIDAI